MATQAQYDVFKSFYEEERQRYEHLGVKANLYVALISFLLGTVALKYHDLTILVAGVHGSRTICLLVILLVGVSLLLTICATLVRSFERPTDPEVLVHWIIGRAKNHTDTSDDEFFDRCIADVVVATNRNHKQNDRQATYLKVAAYVLSIASFILVALLTVVLIRLMA